MALGPPKPGQVIDYRYLWWSEHRAGQEEGRKRRPCAVVFAVENDGGKTSVYVLPITHTNPSESESGVELLAQWKQHLRLDDQPSWIIASELNHFEWPGPDVVGDRTDEISRGFLPHKVTMRLRELVLARIHARGMRSVDRDFDVKKAFDELRQRGGSVNDKARDK